MSESELSQRAAQETLPLRDAFSVLFFVAVGMLFDPTSLVNDPLPILAVLFIIVIGKSVGAFLIVIAFGYPIATALTISASLAQIGEFSFILADLGIQLGVLPKQGRDLILAGALLSIVLNPLVFAGVDRLKPWFERRRPPAETAPDAPRTSTLAKEAEPAECDDGPPLPTKLNNHAVLVGYGRVGSLVGKALKESGKPFLVIEDGEKPLASLRTDGIEVIVGNAASSDILAAANLKGASDLIVAIPNGFEAGQVVSQARATHPGMRIVARAHSDAEVEHLMSLGANAVVMGEREIARGLIEEMAGGTAATAPDGTLKATAVSRGGEPDVQREDRVV
jgi:CPA2 family monovalent cation:H+ antiporter-2